jgi:hypothetical protein
MLDRFCVLTAHSSSQQIWALRDAGDEQTTWRDIAARKGGFALV